MAIKEKMITPTATTKSPFKFISIETTTKCNRRCVYCPNHKHYRGDNFMPTRLYKKIIKELKDMNYSGALSPSLYGEPLCDKRIIRLIKYTRKHLPNCAISFSTNGDGLTLEKINTLIKAGINEIGITIHEEKLDKYSSDLKKIAKKQKLQRRIDIETFSKNKRRKFFNRGGLITKEDYNKLSFYHFKKCSYAVYHMNINYKGDVILCCNDFFGSYVYGNLKKESIMDIWLNPEYRKVRMNTANGVFELDICKRCTGLIK